MRSEFVLEKAAIVPSKGGLMVRKVIKYIVFAALIAFLVGCGAASKKIIIKSHSERTDIFNEVREEGMPPKGFVDLVIKASIKTHLEEYYIFESRKSLHGKPGYPFVFNIDGQGVVWSVDGQKETTPLYDEKGKRTPEGGTGMRYTIEKKIRLTIGPHVIFFGLPEDKYSVKFKIELSEGQEHVLEFKPIYTDSRHWRKPNFKYGISKYEIFLNGNPVLSQRRTPELSVAKNRKIDNEKS